MVPETNQNADGLKVARLHHQAGRLVEAEAGYRQILRARPGFAPAVHGLGLVNHQTGRQEEAISLLRQAVAASPQSAEFRSNLAAVLGRTGRHAEAAKELREALRIKPDFPEGWLNLGVALEKSGKPAEAVDALRRAIAQRPEYGRAHNFLGNALRRTGKWAEAEAAQREAVRLDPADSSAYGNLATTLGGLGWLDEVVACRRKVAELRPKSPSAGSALLSTLHYHAASTPKSLLAEARSWAKRHADRLSETIQTHENDRDPNRRLRIGFYSGNLTAHPEGRLLRPLLANLDRDAFETFVFSATAKSDGLTATLKHLPEKWHEIGSMNDVRAARLIRDERIDILVDLTGHFGNNRMLLFARRPAPVQVIHFGYPGTSGLKTMDWRISDSLADPSDGHPYTSERLWRLPDFAWCYEPPLEARPVASKTAGDRPCTFVCVNNTIKVTSEAIALWSRILNAVPNSKLELLAEGGGRRDANPDDRGLHLQQAFAGHGIEPGRIVLIPRQARARYFEWIHSGDVALDPFPYNGGVTTCDTLWMGVPVVTLAGDSYWSRQGAAILSLIGHPELVAQTPDQYVELAVGLARDRQRAAALRGTLRERMRVSRVMDCADFCRELGKAYRSMWAEWCRNRRL